MSTLTQPKERVSKQSGNYLRRARRRAKMEEAHLSPEEVLIQAVHNNKHKLEPWDRVDAEGLLEAFKVTAGNLSDRQWERVRELVSSWRGYRS